MKTIVTVRVENEFMETYLWLQKRIKEAIEYHDESYLSDAYVSALKDVEKMFLRTEPLLILLK